MRLGGRGEERFATVTPGHQIDGCADQTLVWKFSAWQRDEPTNDIHNRGGLPNQFNRQMGHSLPCLLLSRLHNPLHAARCLQVGQMRAALKEVWQRLLWTTLYAKQHVRHPR